MMLNGIIGAIGLSEDSFSGIGESKDEWFYQALSFVGFSGYGESVMGDYDWPINPIILDTKALPPLFSYADFKHVHRALNG